MKYILEIADENLDRAVHAMAAAGVDFDPDLAVAYVNGDADLDHVCTGEDAPAVMEALNGMLEYNGSPRRLRIPEGGLTRSQTRSLLSIASELICWSRNRPVDDSAVSDHGGVEAVVTNYHPDLALLFTPA